MTANKPAPTTKIVIASKDIPLGAVLSPENLTTSSVGTVPNGAIMKTEEAVGRGVLAPIAQGEPILQSKLAGIGAGGGLAPTIPNGMRAIAVKVDEVIGVAGFVIAGMRVDVLITGIPPNAMKTSGTEATQTQTVLQNIQVLSAGTDIQRDAEGKPKTVQVVNLLVTPEQAQMMSLATSTEKIQLVLRNPLDTQIGKVPATPIRTLFLDKAAAPLGKAHVKKTVVPTAKVYTIIISNGSKMSKEEISFPEGLN